ncbi:MAG TPA: SdrD B-like domain-containing protein [Thermoanaerobaculia bacterium]|nr:SdrD B-like domain-containing protein [Thermoanaerobaculia bacterium]
MSYRCHSRVLSWVRWGAAAMILFVQPSFGAGTLSVRLNAPYNVIVDSNVCSPSTYAPQVATIGAGFCNTGDAPLTDVVGHIGNFSAGTPGSYPVRDSAAAANDVALSSACLANTGTYSLTHLGDLVDATRYIGTLDVGECSWQYWSFTYPRRSNPDTCGSPVWCNSNTPNDDLWLPFDAWATSAQGSAANTTWRVTMRNEISASANKIFPNGGSWFNEPSTCFPGQTVVTNGINYQLGNVGQGFDNDGDGDGDFNAFLQPIGDTGWNPACFRLVKTSGQLTISTSGGGTQLYDFEDQLYFTDLPSNNNGVTGIVYYEFMCLDGACAVPLTPYQEAASGSDNEKFAGDYGTDVGELQSVEPSATLGKTVADTSPLDGRASAGETLNYTVTLTNNETVPIGRPDLGVPLVIRDSIPAGTKYAGGTATASFGCCGVSILYSVDGGTSWSSTQPGNPALVTTLMWRLQAPLPVGAAGTVGFGVTVNNPYSGNPVILNTAKASFGDSSPFLQASAAIPVLGTARIGDTIFRDDGAGTPANANNGVLNAGETVLANVGLSLYWDVDGDGVLDAGEPLVATTSSGAAGSGCGGTGNYCFTGLAAGNFLAVVDKNDADLPVGYRLTTPTPGLPRDTVAVTGLLAGQTVATVDFGFGPSLLVAKTRTSAAISTEGQVVTYTLSATNSRPASQACSYNAWAEAALGTSSFTNAGNAAGAQGPDGLYASGGEGGSGNNLNLSTFGIGTPSGTIASATLQIPLYIGGSLVNDDLDWTVTDVVGGQTLSGTISTATLNTAVGAANAKTVSVNVSSILTTFAEVAGATVQFIFKHTGGSDGIVLFVDATGLQVTTNEVCGAPSDDMRTVPMTDVYDADVLQFLDATLTPSGSSVTGTAPNRVGTLTWDLGPLRSQQTKTVTVRFLAAEQDTNGNGEADVVIHTNTEAVTGALFFDNGAVNNASATATHQVDPRGSVSGFVWADLGVTPNGVKNAGEPGIPFVTVELLNGTCTAGVNCPTTVTDSTGFYSFTGLATGNYRVLVRTATLPGAGAVQTGDPDQVGIVCTTCDNQNTVAKALALSNNNAADDDFANNNFGYSIGNVVFGTLWEDFDGDGVRDPGEPALAGITVDLTNGVCVVGSTCPRVTTDASGRYRFVNVANGNWSVSVLNSSFPAIAAPQFWQQTGDPDQPGVPCTACDATKSAVSVTGGNIFGAYDFGYRRAGTSSIGDTLYADWNGNGSQGAGEEGIANVTVTLIRDVNGDGVRDCGTDTICGNADDVDVVRAVTTTNAGGNYSFTALPAGTWIVAVDQGDPDFLAAYTSLSQTQDPDQAGVCTVCDGKASVTTNGTAAVATVDFGYRPIGFGSIGDYVWNDANGNGLQDGSEHGLLNITVTLYEDSNGNGVIDAADAVVGTAITDSAGSYHFYNLPVRSYLVDVDQTDAQIPTDAYGNRYILSGGTDPLAVSLAANQQLTTADFGFGPGATIGDRVYRDDNGDGTQAANEPGINNVTVQLYRDNDGNKVFSVGDTLVATQVTATVNGNAGTYQFTGLTPGNYVVRVDSTDVDLPGTNWTADPDATLDGQHGITLSASQDVVFADFGVRPPNVLGDRVWNDEDGDGVQDATEPGIAGVVVSLFSRPLGSTGAYALVTTVTTDTDGAFTFGNLAAAQYRLDLSTATALTGYNATYEKDAGVCPPGTCNRVTDITIPLAGLTDLTLDFGFRQPARLTIDKDTTTPTVNPGGQAIYTIEVRNAGDTTATLVQIVDALMPEGGVCPGSCFTLASFSIAADAGVVRTTTTNPAVGATNLTWGLWTLPANAGVTITYTVNVPAGMAAGTYDNTATARFDSNGNAALDAGDPFVDDAGATAQDADTPVGQDPESDEDVTVSSAALGIGKTSLFITDGGAANQVNPGDVLQYTMVLTNNGTTGLTNVTLSDAAPTGTTYVAASSTIVSYRTDTITTFADDFDGIPNYPAGSDGTTAWVNNWSLAGAAVSDLGDFSMQIGRNQTSTRSVNLAGFYRASLRFNVRRSTIDTGDPLEIRVGGTLLGTLDGLGMTGSACNNPGGSGAQTDAAYIAITCTISTLTSPAVVSFATTSALESGDFFYIDDVVVERAIRVTAGPIAGDAPSALVPASGGYSLLAGETMTVRFQATANNPLPVGFTQITNTAFAASTQTPTPVSASASNPIANLPTASISGTVWDDNSGASANGVIDPSEPKLDSVRVELWSDPNGDGNPADGVRLATALTSNTGAYTFSAIAAGNYVVVVATDTLPVSYTQTGDPDEAGVCTVCNSYSQAVSTGSNTVTKNFGYRYTPTPLPVTLSSFHAELQGSKLRFTWTTDTETDNIGFYIFGLVGEDWVPVHNHLIPTKNGNSVAPLTYRLDTDAIDADAFLLADIDSKGREHVHGPFPLGEWDVSQPAEMQAIPWAAIRQEHRAKAAQRQGSWKKKDIPTVRLVVEADGLYRVTFEDLKAAGIDMSKAPLSQLALFDRAGAVPIYVVGNGTFGPGEAIEFYGKAAKSLYSDRNNYTLRVEPGAALRASDDNTPAAQLRNPVTVYRETVRVENQTLYNPAAPGDDPWYDQDMMAIFEPAGATFSLTLTDPVPSAGPARLGVDLWGITDWPGKDPDHHVVVSLNGTELADAQFNGADRNPISVEIPADVLSTGANQIDLELPLDQGLDWDIVGLNAYEITYPRRLLARNGHLSFRGEAAQAFTVGGLTGTDVSVYRLRGNKLERIAKPSISAGTVTFAGAKEAADYVVATAARKLKPEILAAPAREDIFAGSAEYLVISHPDFTSGVAPLVDHRRAQGMTTQVVDVEQVYENLSNGMVDPEAIRQYVAYAAREKGTRYVMLVGGDTYDYKDYLGLGSLSFIPSLYTPAGGIRFVPADPLYGDVDRDSIPDLAVGRLPVRTSGELAAVVAKTLAYDAKNYGRTFLSASDGYDSFERISFSQISHQLLDGLGADWSIEHADVETLGIPVARAKVINSLNGGVAFAQYFGHSSYNVWSFSILFASPHAMQLQNAGRPAVVAQWGCWNTYYVHPTINTLGHALMVGGEQGAAAVLGATAITDSQSDIELGQRYLPRIVQPGATIGDALLAAKRDLAQQHPEMRDVIIGWTILGDPALVVEPQQP